MTSDNGASGGRVVAGSKGPPAPSPRGLPVGVTSGASVAVRVARRNTGCRHRACVVQLSGVDFRTTGAVRRRPPGVRALWGQTEKPGRASAVTQPLPLASDEHKQTVAGTTNPRSGSGSELPCPRGATSVRPTRTSGWLCEEHRRSRLAPVKHRWERRTSELNGVIGGLTLERPFAPELPALKRQRAYAVARVARLSADIGPRLDWCGTESLPVRCGCGYVGARKTCRQWWLCSDCRAKRGKSLEADIRSGLARALESEIRTWGQEGGHGMKPQIVLLTLTQKHSGNLTTDQAALAEGWRALYKRMNEDYGKFPYAAVWEVTTGDDGLGHVHMHIAAIWRYRDWSRVRQQWLRACPTSQRITFVAKRRDGKPSSPSSTAKYLGKYLSKGVDTRSFNPWLRAEVSAAFYNQRSVLASLGFFKKYEKCCKKCNERYRLEEVPKPDPFERLPSMSLNLFFHGLEPPANPAIATPLNASKPATPEAE